MNIYRDGALQGMRCEGEVMVVSLSAPTDHACGFDDVAKKIQVKCPSDQDLELEITATFRCQQCPAKVDG
jgi:hypothetical protein